MLIDIEPFQISNNLYSISNTSHTVDVDPILQFFPDQCQLHRTSFHKETLPENTRACCLGQTQYMAASVRGLLEMV